ncbi:hypothetical protein [Prevotella denticola]|uniref:hypothetical protein n=1 Tax=Prevotella denticola TaxID=28129 RepID=UPI00325FA296
MKADATQKNKSKKTTFAIYSLQIKEINSNFASALDRQQREQDGRILSHSHISGGTCQCSSAPLSYG